MTTIRRVLRKVVPIQRTRTRSHGAPGGKGVDYEGSWNQYARDWRTRFPTLSHLGDEWTGRESGAARSVDEYVSLIAQRFIAPYIEDTDTVLEIGVGGGRTAVLLRRYAAELICADIAAEMLDVTRTRLGDDGVRYVKLDGVRLDGIPQRAVDVCFIFDTLVHVEPRDIFNYLTRIPALMRGKRLCILHHGNMLSERGWQRFLKEWDKNLMGRRHGRSFSVMTDGIMQRFLDHLGYEVLVKDTESIPRDCVWVVRAPEVATDHG
jgi:ubiquinone/menaquinone biosynthesis C-methylase UbiE